MNTYNWWESAKIYELYVDRFARNFKGLTAKLDYFTYLGITALHILPHYPSPMVDDGYDISDFRNVRTELGTLDDFSVFIHAAHSKGINVIVDLVANHVSSAHPWFIEARTSKKNSKRDWFLWSETGAEFKDASNPFIDFKPSNWIRNDATHDYYYATFYPEQPDLNWDNPYVLEEILSTIDFWVDRGVDGFRLDAVPFLVERDHTTSLGLPETHRVIRAIHDHLQIKHKGEVMLLAEVGGTTEEAQKYFGAGGECEVVYHFSLAAQMLLALKRRDDRAVRDMAAATTMTCPGCTWAIFLRNHDDVSMTSLSDAERVELLAFLDPNRQYLFSKGRTTSVRLGTVFEHDQEGLVDAFTLLYSLPGAPIMYYGDEIGLKNLPVRPDTQDSRKYVRGDFDWTVAERMMADSNSLLNTVAKCIQGK